MPARRLLSGVDRVDGRLSCYVYGLQLKSEQLDMTDPGTTLGASPDAECAATASRCRSIEANQRPYRDDHRDEARGAHSDNQLIRVSIRRGSARDSYWSAPNPWAAAPAWHTASSSAAKR